MKQTTPADTGTDGDERMVESVAGKTYDLSKPRQTMILARGECESLERTANRLTEEIAAAKTIAAQLATDMRRNKKYYDERMQEAAATETKLAAVHADLAALAHLFERCNSAMQAP